MSSLLPKEALRGVHATICDILDGSDDTLLSFSIRLKQDGIIDQKVNNSVSRKPGLQGANTLITHVQIMVEQEPALFDTVLEAMEEQKLLRKVAADLRTKTGRPPRSSTSGASDTVSSDGSKNTNEDEPCAPPKSPRSVFRDNFATICDLVTETTKFANDLSTAQLISDPTLDNVTTNASLNRYEKVNACMGEIRHLVSLEKSPRPIESLCDVLKKQSNTSLDILADKMLKELGKQSKIERTCVKKTSPARQNSSDDSSLHLKKRKVDLSQDNAVVTDKNGRVSTSHIRILNQKLWSLHPDWRKFGRELGLNDSVIRNIGSSGNEDIQAKFQTAMTKWRKKGGTRTWRVVHDALLEIHRKDIADDIKEKHNLDDDVPHTKDSYVADMTHALEDVIPEWESFARSLGLDNSTIQIIKGDEKTCFSDLLRMWIQEKGHDADIHCMLSACEKIDKDLADQLRIDEGMCSAFPVLGKMKQEQ